MRCSCFCSPLSLSLAGADGQHNQLLRAAITPKREEARERRGGERQIDRQHQSARQTDRNYAQSLPFRLNR